MRERVVAVLFWSVWASGCAQSVSGARADAQAPVDVASPSDAAGPPVDAAVQVPPGGVSDDCAPGTWCWELPTPTGEAVIAAQSTGVGRVVVATASGTLARYDGARWSTRRVDTPSPVNGLWAAGDDDVFLTCADTDGRAGAVLRVRGAQVDRLPLPAGVTGVSSPTGTGPDDVWMLAARQLVHFDGAALTAVDGVEGQPYLSGLRMLGRGEVEVLESWGSGSGFGRIHQRREGVWARTFEFRSLNLRVDGPFAVAGGEAWLRATDMRRGDAALVRFDGATWEAFASPSTSVYRVFSLGDTVAVSNGAALWWRQGERWTRAEPTVDDGALSAATGSGAGDLWLFRDRVSRRVGEAWRDESPRVGGALGFFPGGVEPTLLSTPSTVVTRDAASGRWRVGPRGEAVYAVTWSTVGRAWVAQEREVVEVDQSGASLRREAWPMGTNGSGVRLAAYRGARDILWMSDGEAVIPARFEGEALTGWGDPIAAPRLGPEGRVQGQVAAMHVSADGVLWVGSSAITGDKTVYLAVHRWDGAWRQVLDDRGEFGGFGDVQMFTDPLHATLWVGTGALHRWDGAQMVPIEGGMRINDLQVLGDDVFGTDGRRVLQWDLRGAARAIPREIPLGPELRASHLRVERDGTVRVAGATWVLRYTP